MSKNPLSQLTLSFLSTHPAEGSGFPTHPLKGSRLFTVTRKQCRRYNVLSSVLGHWILNNALTSFLFFISLTAPPRFSAPMMNKTQNGNSQLVVECGAYGIPVPDYLWRFNGSIVTRHRSLNLSSLSLDDRGFYTCIANNSLGSANGGFYLTIQGIKHIIANYALYNEMLQHFDITVKPQLRATECWTTTPPQQQQLIKHLLIAKMISQRWPLSQG